MTIHQTSFRPVIVGHGPKAVIRLHERIEELEEENRQLRDRMAQLTGQNDLASARSVFDFTESEGRIFVMLLHCGKAEYGALQDVVYSEAQLLEADMPREAIRTHIKRMRRKMRRYALDFKTIYSLGYEMSEDMRHRARALIKQAVTA